MIGPCAAALRAAPRIAAQTTAAALNLRMRSIVITLSPSRSCVYWQTSATTTLDGEGSGSPFTVTLTSNRALALSAIGGEAAVQNCVPAVIEHDSAVSARSLVPSEVRFVPTLKV